MKKIGIVTFHSAYNFGSVLQSFAMAKTMCNLGLDAKIIDFRHPKTTAAYEAKLWDGHKSLKLNIEDFILRILLRHGVKRDRLFAKFIDNYLPLTQRYNSCKNIDEYFDYLVCGSDQIWNPIATGCNHPIYYLDFGLPETIKFSYAASSGTRPFAEGAEWIKMLLQSYKGIGVREEYMQHYIADNLNLHSEINPDPTFLIDKEQWVEIEQPCEGLPEKYLLLYSLSARDEILALARRIADSFHLPLVFINTNMRMGYYDKVADYNLHDVGPCQFIWLFNHARFIVTNTFHGNMFSVIFRKNFISYNPTASDSRIQTLHDTIGFAGSRRISSFDEFKKINPAIEYNYHETPIEEFKLRGLSYIKNMIG